MSQTGIWDYKPIIVTSLTGEESAITLTGDMLPKLKKWSSQYALLCYVVCILYGLFMFVCLLICQSLGLVWDGCTLKLYFCNVCGVKA